MIEIAREGARFRSEQDGIESWHCFSAGASYDPDNVSYGPLVGFDEHHLAPGAGFDWHGHRGVSIVSWVLAGRLRHEDADGPVREIGPGQALVQRAGSGIRHREANASPNGVLRLVQMTVLDDVAGASVTVADPPVAVAESRFRAWTRDAATDAPRWFVFVADGAWLLDEQALSAGDSVRGTGPMMVTGAGVLLMWEFDCWTTN